MTRSDQTLTVPSSISKEKRAKIFYEHGTDALQLAHLVANMQEEKALRKAGKHHQPQAGKPRTERKNGDRPSEKRKRLVNRQIEDYDRAISNYDYDFQEDVKVIIAKRRTEAKKEKARARKGSNGRLRQRNDARTAALEGSTGAAAPRKRVSFA